MCLLAVLASLPVLAQQGGNPRTGAAPGAADSRPSSAERDEVVVHVQKAMEELSAAVEELGKRAEKASGEARDRFEQQLRSLREDQKKLEGKLQELKAITARQWKQLQEEIERTLEQIRPSDPKPPRDTI
jgi:TolA-binding protein